MASSDTTSVNVGHGHFSMKTIQTAKIADPIEMQRFADDLPVEQAASRWVVETDPDEHVEKIRCRLPA